MFAAFARRSVGSRGAAASWLAALALLHAPAAAQERPRHLNPPGLPAARGYSQVVEVPPGARLLYVSGQVPLDSAGNLVGPGDFRAQAHQVFRNLTAALAAAGAGLGDVVKFTYFVLDPARVPELREVRDQYLGDGPPGASSLVAVRGLFRDDILLEIEAVAVAPAGPRPADGTGGAGAP